VNLTKRGLLAIVVMSASAAAHAQSSVTIYGRVDGGLEYMTGLPNENGIGSTSRFRAEGGDWGASLLGFKGVEDIGGGNKILFQLEQAFELMNGQGAGVNTMFFDVDTVGIQNDKYGTLLLGREANISNGDWDFDPFGQTVWASATLVRGRNWQKSSNVISYQSPKIDGFDVLGQYSFSNATSWNGNGTTPQGRENGVQVTYASALFQLRGIYDEIRDPLNGKLDNPFSASREYFGAANLFLGQFSVRAAFTASRTSGMTDTAYGAPTTTNLEWGGVTWQATPAAALTAAVYHVNANNGGGNATIYTAGGTYNLSKRTFLELQVATLHNSKTANFALDPTASEGPGGTVNGIYNSNPQYGHSQSGAYVGIMHSF
jgi:predicted porin